MTDGEWPTESRENGPAGGRTVLYPILQSESDAILHVAAAIARSRDADLVVGYVAEDTSEPTSATTHEVSKTVFRSTMDPAISVDVSGHVLEDEDVSTAILSAVTDYGADTVVMGGEDGSLARTLAKRFDGDLIVVTNERLLSSIASILLPVGGDDVSGAIEVAADLARATDAAVEVVHVAGEQDRSTTEIDDEVFEPVVERLSGIDVVDTRVLSGEDVATVIGEESAYHDLTVLDSPKRGRIRRRLFGSTANEIRERAQNTVVTVRSGRDESSSDSG